MVCQSNFFQRMIILWVRALDTNHSKERTTERLTQIPLSRTKIKEMSRVFFFYYFYHRYLDKFLVKYLDPIHFYQIELGSGSSRDGRTQSVFECHASWWLVMQHFVTILPPVSAMLVGQHASVKLCIIFALQKTHLYRKYVWNRV